MFFIVVGVVLGAAISLGRIPLLETPTNRAVDSLYTMGDASARWVLDRLPLENTGSLKEVLAIALGVAMPGIISLTLILLARGSVQVRRVGSVLLLALAAVVLFTQPLELAVPLAALLAGAAAIMGLAVGALVTAPLAALATVIGVAHVRLVLSTTGDTKVAAGASRLSEIATVGDPGLWKWALLLLAVLPFAAAALAALRGS